MHKLSKETYYRYQAKLQGLGFPERVKPHYVNWVVIFLTAHARGFFLKLACAIFLLVCIGGCLFLIHVFAF